MKRIWIAMIFIILSVSICTYEQIFINSFKNRINNDITQIENNIECKRDIKENVKALNEDYNEFETVIGILSDKDDAQNLKMSIIEFNNLEDNEKRKALIKMRALVNAIYDNQKLSLSNIV